MKGKIYQINVKPKTAGQRGLPKQPVESALVTYSGLDGDFNRWRHEKKGDDPGLALLIMSMETIRELNEEGWPIQPGDIGENITTTGIPYEDFAPGKRYKLGDVEIEIYEICEPCTSLYLLPYVGKEKGPGFMKAMLNRRGWYAKVLQKGRITKGDTIDSLS